MTIEINDPKVAYRTADHWVDAFTGSSTAVGIDFPNESNTGIAAIPGWAHTSELGGVAGIDIMTAGTVIEDALIHGTITVRAPHVTLRRCLIDDGAIINLYGDQIFNDLLVEDCTIQMSSPGLGLFSNTPMAYAGYTCKRTAFLDVNEGWHTGASANAGFRLADPRDPKGFAVRIFDSYCRMTAPPGCDEFTDYHGDGIQTTDFSGGVQHGGVPLTMRNCTIFSFDSFPCIGNAAFMGTHNESPPVDIDKVLFGGSIWTVRFECGGRMTNLFIVDQKDGIAAGQPGDAWPNGANGFELKPIAIPDWSIITDWSAWTCELDAAGQPTVLTHQIFYGHNSTQWPPAPPSPPRSLASTAGSTGQVDLTWVVPLSPGGPPISDYIVETSLDGVAWTTFADAVSAATTATVTGLTSGIIYHFRVTAVTPVGVGTPSDPVVRTAP